MSENEKKRRTVSELCTISRGPRIAVGFATHRAGGRGRKSRTRQGAAQIVFGIAMVTRKIWATKAQDFHDLSWRCMLGEQFAGQPEIDDAPIRTRKTLANAPTLNPTLIDGSCALARERGARYRCFPHLWRMWRGSRDRRTWRRDCRCFGGEPLQAFLGDIERLLCSGSQDGLGMHQLHPVREGAARAARWLAI